MWTFQRNLLPPLNYGAVLGDEKYHRHYCDLILRVLDCIVTVSFGVCLVLWPGTAVAQWLRCWKVAGSIPDGVIGIFH